MANNPVPPRPLYFPRTDLNQRAIPATRQPQRIWFRVHRASAPAVQFGNFPHHRFSHPQCPFPLLFEAIKYTSRFIDLPCLALFDRGGMAARLKVTALGDLNDLDAAVDWLDEREAALV